MIFYQDDAKLNVSLITRLKLLQLGWEILIHPLYSSDIAPSDVHLLQFYKILLVEKKFNSLEDCKKY